MSMQLTPSQQSAVDDPAAIVEIRAGAGTGKTATLIERARREVERAGRVRVLTFSRAAMREARRRLSGPAGELPERIQVDTLHGLAADIIRRHEGDIRIVDEVDVQRLHRETRASGQTLDRALAEHRLTRYGELIPRATELISQSQRVAASECGGSILIDEGQDLSRSQWDLIDALWPDRLTVVYDPSQRIYGWRGAIDPPLHGLSVHELGENWRSTPVILAVANRIPIPGRVDLRPGVMERQGGGDRGAVRSVELPDDLAARTLMVSLEGRPGQTASVLTRTRARAQSMRAHLRALDVPTYAPGLDCVILDQPEGRRVLDLLHSIADPHDALALGRTLRAAGMTEAELRRIDAVRYREACSLWDAVIRHDVYDQIHGGAQMAIVGIYDSIRYRDSAREALEGFGPLLADLDAVEVIPEGLAPSEAIEWAADPDRDAGAAGQPPGAVWVGTIHAAKGLEWDAVAVVGLEEGSLPIRRKGADIDEERRALYVAVTRARRSLLLTWSPSVTQWGRTEERRPSRFLQEIGV